MSDARVKIEFRIKISTSLAEEAARAACRSVWAAMYPGSWDDDCPDKSRWLAEELEALTPALEHLGIEVGDD